MFNTTKRGYDKIELNLYEKGVRRKVMFYGVEITRVERPVDGGIRIDTIYKNCKRAACGSNQGSQGASELGERKSTRMGKPQSWSHDFGIWGTEC